MSVVGGVCLPVSAENDTEAEVITVYYDNTVDETAPAEEAVQEEAPAEAETAEADTAEDAQVTEETEVSEATEEAPAVSAVDEFEAHTNLYHCSSCGADIMCDDEQTALFCYYCHNPVILA